ncbi:MAG: 4-aminobutyrate aminotransferase [Saprospiraceae bacterium]|nr:MAG: 4-aminobutyrate aminotransferase [Saprospiraceae bacterium]
MNYSDIEISIAEAETFARTHYGINGKAKKLMGEVDFNFYLKSDDGKEYTLKVSRPNADIQAIVFQADIMNHLAASEIPLGLPAVVPSTDGKQYIEIENNRVLRLQKWVPGRMLSEVNPRSPELLESWGKTAGLMSKHFAGFDHPAAHRFYKWNPSETLDSRKYSQHIQGQEAQEVADYFWRLFETQALPHLSALRKSVNYNDAHEHNLLTHGDVKTPQVTGVIDFGDALYTETVNELAIACAYACMYMPDPLQAACHVVRGYHQVFPLEEKELAVLFPLICARLMNTVANAAWNKHNEPDNEYLLISEKPAWDLLKKLRNVSPAFAHFSFRHTCGLEPCPSKPLFVDWVREHREQLAPIINFDKKTVMPFDLSVGSLDLGNNENFESIEPFQKTVDRLLEDHGADIGIGGYGEVRPIYTTDAYLVEGNSGAQWRTVHLGMDVWDAAGTPVCAPWEGVVYSVQNNAGERDYGPTIIVKHEVSKKLTFFSLYGHLSIQSLQGITPGMAVKKGQLIATIGPAPENGNWPPHLHFQLMLDMLGNTGDFPGVAFPNERATWLSICPDPAPLFPRVLAPSGEKTVEEILATRHQSLGKSLSISYAKPLHIVRGFKQYLYDTTARRYLDTVNNVPHVGHQHPRVVRAAQRQMAVLNTNTRYLHDNIVGFAEELLATFPPELSVVHFVNSGSEANELAMRMVEAATGQKDMVAVEVGYHGNTSGCIAISSYKFDGKGGKGAPPHTHIVPIPDTYRGLYRNTSEAGKKYATHVQQAIGKIQNQGRNVGGFICESILSCGGQIVLPEGYLKEAYHHVRSAGGLCIADEVQVGFGRVGDKFWGFELQGVLPDIVTLGKPIGNGHPLAAVVTTKKVAEAFANGMEYFNTFGGNPVSCAIGREVLKIVQEEGLQAHAYEVGAYLTKGLKELQKRFPLIGDVRGHGLFLGFELVKNQETLHPAAEEATYLANRMRERGILMSTDGPYHNVLKIKPPMCFSQKNADFFLENLEKVLGEDFLTPT